MKSLLFLLLVIPMLSIGQPSPKQRFLVEFQNADSVFNSESFTSITVYEEPVIDTVTVRAVCSLDYSYNENVITGEIHEPVFVTKLLMIREYWPEYDYYRVVKYTALDGMRISNILNVWQTKIIEQ